MSTDAGTPTPRTDIISLLITVARAAYVAMDGSEQMDFGSFVIDKDDAARLSDALDALDALPELPHPYIGEGPAKAEYLLSSVAPLERELSALRAAHEAAQAKAEMDYAVMAGDAALITGLKADLEAAQAELAALREDAERWKAIKELAGYWQDGSQTTVTLDQDECTHMCFIRVGKKLYGTDNSSFNAAIDAARKAK